MKTKVTDIGVVIPRKLLEDFDEVEIYKEYGHIVVIPVRKDDSIYDLGKNPVELGLTDVAENHDKYLTNTK